MRYTVTAALPYTNGPLHIGHLAGVYIPADIYTRYLRLNQKDVAFICGSDEHGVAISIKAKKEGTSPRAVIDKYDRLIKKSFQDFGIAFDNYSRTSAKIHYDTASEIFLKLHSEGKFQEITTEQLYDEKANQFLADRFVLGTCPKCGFAEAYGDQCENCGSSLNPTDLINPRSTITQTKPVLKSTKHWFLPLNEYSAFIDEWILKGHEADWKTNVYGQVKSWINDGLKPRAVTRDLDWGIPVPLANAEGKVLYVWFDAPIGYISSTKEWALRENKAWEPYWKDKDTELVHFIGKDNIVFHCVIFPAILKAEGSYILPKNVPANEFLNLEGNKISTSKNWAVWLHEYLEEFPNKQDVLRYVLAANMPETKDSEFTWKDFQARNNNELLAIFGNFVNRVLTLTHSYYEGKVPTPNAISNVDKKVFEELAELTKKIGLSIESFRFREALQELMNIARLGNKYLADEQPWKVVKTDTKRVKTVMYVSLQVVAALSLASEPFLPFTSKRLSQMLRLDTLDSYSWADIATKTELLPIGHRVNQPVLLFEKIEDTVIAEQLEKLNRTKRSNQEQAAVALQKDPINFDDFQKIDIRTGTIVHAEKMPKTDKLMVLRVNTVGGERTIVSGIAQHFCAQELVGKKVLVLVNLQPRNLKGIMSEGMLLTAEREDGRLTLLSPTATDVGDGTIIS